MNFKDLVQWAKEARLTVNDKTAPLGEEFYQFWDNIIDGTEIKEGTRVRHPKENPILWKCNEGKTHIKQFDRAPSIDTASLWTAISDNSHTGSIDDPIPVPEQLSRFEYEWGLYYLEDGIKYLCNRDKGKLGEKYELNYKPSQLIGHYFKIVE